MVIKGNTATGSKGDKKLFAYDQVDRKSPTLGKKAPKGAKVLFAGVEMDRFSGGIKLDGNLLEEGVVSLDSFGDFTLHLEFRTPYKPNTKPGNQDRGNSGVYIFNNYETQILDSFGIKGEFNFCGALYRKKAPDLNMCLPPLAWQTYDIEFTAPRFKDRKKVKNARITTRHNGVVIHDDYELDKGTGQAEAAPKRKRGRSTCRATATPFGSRTFGWWKSEADPIDYSRCLQIIRLNSLVGFSTRRSISLDSIRKDLDNRWVSAQKIGSMQGGEKATNRQTHGISGPNPPPPRHDAREKGRVERRAFPRTLLSFQPKGSRARVR